jgi:hypothetical protein
MDGILYHTLFLAEEARKLKQCGVVQVFSDSERSYQGSFPLNKTLQIGR